ncbi:MAG: glycoside hydrolase family 31 protein [Nitriliruptoraceae bacterium]|nr:glycoside hydrolase family 31 protein [Nitriliruptoraceae bacterium]
MLEPHGGELERFLGRTVPLILVDAVLDAEVGATSIVLRCSTRRVAPQLADYYGTVVETVLDEPTAGPDAIVELGFTTAGALRLRVGPADEVADHAPSSSPMLAEVEPAPWPTPPEAGERDITVALGGTTCIIERDPLRLVVRDADGRTVFATRALDTPAFARRPPEWNTAEGRWIFHHRYAYPLGWTDEPGACAFLSVDLAHDERIHGLGEGFGRVDRRGSRHRLWVQEAFSNTSPASYKQVPFWFTSRGYGLFAHSGHPMTVRAGDLDHTAVSLVVDHTRELDLFVLPGPTPARILQRYTQLTGAPGLPPVWSFGLWMSRITYGSQAEVLEVARELRERRIPCDVLHIDTGWFATEYVCDLEFGPQFPDPAAMTRELDADGFKVSLWQWPLVNIHSPLFAEAMEGGHLVRRASGHVYTLPGGFGEDAALLDYSRAETVAWLRERFLALFDLGVAAIKVDYGEGAPPDGVYAGLRGPEAHNLYPLLYQQAIHGFTEQARGSDEAMIWCRSGWAGAQRTPVHWSGDGVARTEDLACVLRSMLSMGLSGFPFSSHDIGGFVSTPDPELYVRWAQLGLFSSHARAHGSPPREPWHYGEQAERIVRDLLELRYRLLPYLWTEARHAVETSTPIVRALLIDHPDDPVAATIEDQYLFGRDLLVAPVLDDRDHRRVYLPAGTWVDLWTEQVHHGPGFIEVAAPLERIPLFVRGGAIVPLARPALHTGAIELEGLTVLLAAPVGPAQRTVHWPGYDDLHLEVAVEDGSVTLDVRGVAAHEVRVIGSDAAEVDAR